ncbi:MAG: ABC transporter ATP-binding protein, partial [Clostridia bacterium]
MTALICENIEFSYGANQILKSVNLSVSGGEIVAITGKSGIGKSTLAYILSGVIPRSIEKTYGGKVSIFGKDILKMSKKEVVSEVGIVFQNPDMQIFSQTIEDEIAFGMENLNFPREKMRETITNLLKF